MSLLTSIKTFFDKLSATPATFQRLLFLVGLTSIVVIVTLSVFGFYRIFNDYVIKSAESQAIELGNMMLERVNQELIASENVIRVTPDAINSIDDKLRPYIRHFDITKVKVFDRDGRIAFSTDKNIIGKRDQNNKRLNLALDGIVNSKLEKKSMVRDLAEETHFNADVVETYVPIFDKRKNIIGSFEIYLQVTKYRDAIRRNVILSSVILSFILLSAFAVSHLVIAYSLNELKHAHKKLSDLAFTDALTGLVNHGFLLKKGCDEFERFRRKPGTIQMHYVLSCIMLDIDFFKKINDSHGHLVGDQILKEFAGRLNKRKREYDTLGRYGGEEFVMLLPATSEADARKIAERLLQDIRQNDFTPGALKVKVTASAGVSGTRASDQSLQDLFHRADLALYQAKHDGRDRFVVY